MITNALLAILSFVLAGFCLLSAIASTPGCRSAGVDPKLKIVNVVSVVGFFVCLVMFVWNVIKFIAGLF